MSDPNHDIGLLCVAAGAPKRAPHPPIGTFPTYPPVGTRHDYHAHQTGTNSLRKSPMTEADMLLAVAALLLVLWLLGFLAFHLGAFIHILIVVAVVVLVLHFVRGRRAGV